MSGYRPITWTMSWQDKIRQFFGFRPSREEIERRREYVKAGGNWPPLPYPVPPPPPPPAVPRG